jgi:hypothetical protein
VGKINKIEQLWLWWLATDKKIEKILLTYTDRENMQANISHYEVSVPIVSKSERKLPMTRTHTFYGRKISK